MNILIVYAHPNKQSLSYATLQSVLRGLEESAHSHTIIDLYEDQFNPVLIFNDKIKRRDMKNDPETAEYREKVQQADHMIFIFPVWWSGAPAILKGFFDRVFASDFAYTYQGNIPKGLLKNMTATIIYTQDAPKLFANTLGGKLEWKWIKRAVLGFCGVRKIKRLVFWGVRTSTKNKREQWLSKVYEYVRAL
ncbi:NAD(P)H-dependent oxidoreductase [Terrilactibacillus laevilacticus]|uniref:NAD(P)H-dependent oxidoreductase n=1 Tax=Terrilactibacillus laevilacticus TaxID=1380157 RepID=A0ABW5PNR5_9BACI|nr:NAD(P)H-dependent oxidoreductase [Terrilactibacillus laevilacticus]